jgi:hypothetical protein
MQLHTKALIFFFTAVLVVMIQPLLIPAIIVAFVLLDWYMGPRREAISKPIVLLDAESIELQAFLETKKQYMKSIDWEMRRVNRYTLANGKCESCDITLDSYQVHHISNYYLIPNEPLSSLRALCSDCHSYQHEIYGYPKTLQDYKDWNKELL